MSSLLTSFGKNVRQRREALGLTQEELSRLIARKRTTVTNLEAGRQNVTLLTAATIAAALGCQLADLLDERAYRKAVKENVARMVEHLGLRVAEVEEKGET